MGQQVSSHLPKVGEDDLPIWNVTKTQGTAVLTPVLDESLPYSTEAIAVMLSKFAKDSEDIAFTKNGHFWSTPNAFINMLCNALGLMALHVTYDELMTDDAILKGVQNVLLSTDPLIRKKDFALTISMYTDTSKIDGHMMCIYRKTYEIEDAPPKEIFYCVGVYNIMYGTAYSAAYPRFEDVVERLFSYVTITTQIKDSTWSCVNSDDNHRWRCINKGRSDFEVGDVANVFKTKPPSRRSFLSLEPLFAPQEIITAHRFDVEIQWCRFHIKPSSRIESSINSDAARKDWYRSHIGTCTHQVFAFIQHIIKRRVPFTTLVPKLRLTSAYNIQKMMEVCFAVIPGAKVTLRGNLQLEANDLVALFRRLETSHEASDVITSADFDWVFKPTDTALLFRHTYTGTAPTPKIIQRKSQRMFVKDPITGITSYAPKTTSCSIQSSFVDRCRRSATRRGSPASRGSRSNIRPTNTDEWPSLLSTAASGTQ